MPHAIHIFFVDHVTADVSTHTYSVLYHSIDHEEAGHCDMCLGECVVSFPLSISLHVCLFISLSLSLSFSQSYSHNFLLAHGAQMHDEEDQQEEGGGVGDEEEPIPTSLPPTGPLITSTPVLVPVAREEDVWESEGVRGRGEGEEEDDKWGEVAEKIDPEDLLGG